MIIIQQNILLFLLLYTFHLLAVRDGEQELDLLREQLTTITGAARAYDAPAEFATDIPEAPPLLPALSSPPHATKRDDLLASIRQGTTLKKSGNRSPSTPKPSPTKQSQDVPSAPHRDDLLAQIREGKKLKKADGTASASSAPPTPAGKPAEKNVAIAVQPLSPALTQAISAYRTAWDTQGTKVRASQQKFEQAVAMLTAQHPEWLALKQAEAALAAAEAELIKIKNQPAEEAIARTPISEQEVQRVRTEISNIRASIELQRGLAATKAGNFKSRAQAALKELEPQLKAKEQELEKFKDMLGKQITAASEGRPIQVVTPQASITAAEAAVKFAQEQRAHAQKKFSATYELPLQVYAAALCDRSIQLHKLWNALNLQAQNLKMELCALVPSAYWIQNLPPVETEIELARKQCTDVLKKLGAVAELPELASCVYEKTVQSCSGEARQTAIQIETLSRTQPSNAPVNAPADVPHVPANPPKSPRVIPLSPQELIERDLKAGLAKNRAHIEDDEPLEEETLVDDFD